MANREELAIIRAARAGQAAAQLSLGKLYLFGGAGLPHSPPTALHWLERAAQQGSDEACELIGAHIPLALARRNGRPLAQWYARAYDGGVAGAGLVLAQLVLDEPAESGVDDACRAKALRALTEAARDGVAEAQWLLSRQQVSTSPAAAAAAAAPPAAAVPPAAALMAGGTPSDAAPNWLSQRWLRRAADGGLPQAQFAVLDAAWDAHQWDAYLQRALPLARALVLAFDAAGKGALALAPAEVTLLSRCARALARAKEEACKEQACKEQACTGIVGVGPADTGADSELHRFWELAAAGHDRYAQLALGLWCARMRADGSRTAVGAGSANFKKAIRWLTLAGEQGLAEAWYALSRIYIKPEFSQRNVLDAQKHLERAAAMGYRDAQFECGNNAWRARRESEANDVRAVYWLQKAAALGCAAAAAALRKIAPRPVGTAYTETGALSAGFDLAASHPLLAARLELAALFSLSRAEALLLDIRQADHGHCLVIDIRASYGRSKRRLALVETAQQRHALDRIVQLFEDVDCSSGGPEGNYRQRLYRLKTLLPEAGDKLELGERYDLAA
jgi:TPR repeat protein